MSSPSGLVTDEAEQQLLDGLQSIRTWTTQARYLLNRHRTLQGTFTGHAVERSLGTLQKSAKVQATEESSMAAARPLIQASETLLFRMTSSNSIIAAEHKILEMESTLRFMEDLMHGWMDIHVRYKLAKHTQQESSDEWEELIPSILSSWSVINQNMTAVIELFGDLKGVDAAPRGP